MSRLYPRTTGTLVTLLLIFALAITAVSAQDENSVTITAAADGVTVPESLPEGLVTVTFDNTGEAPFVPILVQLKEGATLDDFFGALGGDPAQLPEVAILKGGTMINPASTAVITYNFTPGDYVLVNFAAEEPQIANFSVEDDANVDTSELSEEDLPESVMTLALVDFAFAVPAEVEAGEQTWMLENIGEQWHEMVIYKIDAELPLDEAHDLVMESMTADDPSALGLEQTFLWLPMSEGERAWVTLDLEPGTYALACYLPDIEALAEATPAADEATPEAGEDDAMAGHSHLEKGMILFINVD